MARMIPHPFDFWLSDYEIKLSRCGHRATCARRLDGRGFTAAQSRGAVQPTNLRAGVTGIPFLQYLGAPLVGIIPGLAIYVYFGMFGEHLRAGPVGQLSRFCLVSAHCNDGTCSHRDSQGSRRSRLTASPPLSACLRCYEIGKQSLLKFGLRSPAGPARLRETGGSYVRGPSPL